LIATKLYLKVASLKGNLRSFRANSGGLNGAASSFTQTECYTNTVLRKSKLHN